MSLGIIAEDESDVVVVKELAFSLLKSRRLGTKHFIGHGCGKLRRKCGAWAYNLARRGCKWLAVVHDLDTYNERDLRTKLATAIAGVRTDASVILIPKREIEAWLLYDSSAIAAAFGERKRPKLPGNPESLPDPKAFLNDLVRKLYRKEYLNTRHNEAIAKHISLSRLRKASSFAPYPLFITRIQRQL